MPLTSDHKEILRTKLGAFLGKAICPVCAKTGRSIKDYLVAAPQVENDQIKNDRGALFIVAVCNHCTHAHLFSAIDLGLVPIAQG